MGKAPPELPGGPAAESPIDRALALALAGEHETALRWAAAVVAAEPGVPSGYLVTGRLLADLGRQQAAREAFEVCIQRATDASQLTIAIAACSDLRKLGVDPSKHYDALAETYAAHSGRLGEHGQHPPKLPTPADQFHPLPSVLTGPALLGKAIEIVHHARRAFEEETAQRAAAPRVAFQPLFSTLSRSALRAMIEVFEVISVPQGTVVIEEGADGSEAYIVARGELEVSRVLDDRTVVLARLTGGALIGEMALVSRAPRAASVMACRPSILLMARKDALDRVATREPEIGAALATHCRHRMIQNLVRTSPILSAVQPEERPALFEQFTTCVFEKGAMLIDEGEAANGLHLIASGEVAIIRSEGRDPLVIATLGPGNIVGEVSLVLRRPSSAGVVAVHPTITLYLASEKFMPLVHEHPAVLSQLYELAVRREEETRSIVAQEVTDSDDYVLV